LPPGILLPLHIFEDRYLKMVESVVQEGNHIGMALPLEGRSVAEEWTPPIHPIIGLGRILRVSENSDGSLDLVLQGVSRMEILEEIPTLHPFRMVRARALPDIVSEEDLFPRIEKLLLRFQTIEENEMPGFRSYSPSSLIDQIMLGAPIGFQEKQWVFSEPDVARRLLLLEGLLEKKEEYPG
jgi:Lon protease-like protein